MTHAARDPIHSQPLADRPHYPTITRTLIALFEAGELTNVRSILVEPEFGRAARIVYCDGSVRLFRGKGLTLALNGAARVAEDKGYTKFFLQSLGYETPPGRVFPTPRNSRRLNRILARFQIATTSGAKAIDTYVRDAFGYPCYVKPNQGSEGDGVTRCESIEDVAAAIMVYERSLGALLVEQAVPWPDYRVLVMHGEVLVCYLRRPLRVVGDGISSVRELLRQENERLALVGRGKPIMPADARMARTLARQGLTLESVPAAGAAIRPLDISNLSAGGEAEDCTARLHPRWQELCVQVTVDMGLDLAGVDLACADIDSPEAAYSILEVNAAPGMEHFAASGPEAEALAREICRRVFNTPPG
jgi:D-alanine-D-alanine ligase-like ATP-grasp enzyme